jgi:DNA-binding protein H-NS
MKNDSYITLKQKIEKEIQKLQKQAEALQKKRRGPVIASIVKSMREYDITPEEITSAFTKKAPGRSAGPRAAATKPAAKRAVVPPKYRHPESGATWTGRGKAPRWVTDAEKQGVNRDSFLIKD